MKLWTELQEKVAFEDEDMRQKEVSLLSQASRKKSASQQEPVSEPEETKSTRQRTGANQSELAGKAELPSDRATAEGQLSEGWWAMDREYVMSLIQDVSRKVKKPLFNTCLAHAGIAYYIQFNREPERQANENTQVLANDMEEKQQREILEMLKNMNENV
eukprot:TRINITY_DN5863_c0_g1_i3.p1 TRINITY_DN5863_c0_g1~~TRINITY_DN5863_c0_g1_i3.p1  ORF type:complete len:160 (-),score=59.79 TRINITY_DN5863_c0_g1_i3:78-557(-)